MEGDALQQRLCRHLQRLAARDGAPIRMASAGVLSEIVSPNVAQAFESLQKCTFERSRLRAGGASASLAEARGEPRRAVAGARRARREILRHFFSAASSVSALNVFLFTILFRPAHTH